MSPWTASYIALWLLTAVMAGSIVVLFRQLGLLHLRFGPRGALATDNGLPVGTEAPHLAATDLAGNSHDIPNRAGSSTLIFVSPKCSVCELILPAVKSIYRRLPRDSQLIVISDGDAQSAAKYSEKLKGVPVVASSTIPEAFHVASAPLGMHIDFRGVVRAKGVINTLEHIEGLVEASNMELAMADSDAEPVNSAEGVHAQ